MALTKRQDTAVEPVKQDIPTQEQLDKVAETLEKVSTKKTMTKDEYWIRREERDVETSKNMAWSGLAQAALMSVSVAQLNADNTEDGLVALVTRITTKLLQARDSK